jgi:hypothetical protein
VVARDAGAGVKRDEYAYWLVLRRTPVFGAAQLEAAFGAWFDDAARADPESAFAASTGASSRSGNMAWTDHAVDARHDARPRCSWCC